MDHITKASRNQTDTQFKATLDPLAVQPQESRVAGDQETALITRTGASFIVKPAVRPFIQEKAPPPEAGSSLSKLSKGGAVQARSAGRGAGGNLKKFPRVEGH